MRRSGKVLYGSVWAAMRWASTKIAQPEPRRRSALDRPSRRPVGRCRAIEIRTTEARGALERPIRVLAGQRLVDDRSALPRIEIERWVLANNHSEDALAFLGRKVRLNIARNRRNARLLRQGGWRWKVLVIWECDTFDSDRVANLMVTFLGDRKPACWAEA